MALCGRADVRCRSSIHKFKRDRASGSTENLLPSLPIQGMQYRENKSGFGVRENVEMCVNSLATVLQVLYFKLVTRLCTGFPPLLGCGALGVPP